MSDDTAPASAPAKPRPAPIGDPLLPRAEEAELPRRARAAAAAACPEGRTAPAG